MGKMTKVELLNMNLVVKGFDSILEVLDSIFNSIIKKRGGNEVDETMKDVKDNCHFMSLMCSWVIKLKRYLQ
jgi:hypothetical protein